MFVLNNYWALALLIFGSLVAISSNTWPGAWAGLEINMVSFIIVAMNKKNNYNTECVVKYFLIQSISSLIIMAQVFNDQMNLSYTLMASLPLMVKLGMYPFYYWVLDVNSNVKTHSSFILLTWQKLAPMALLSNFISGPFILLILLSGPMSSFIGLSFTAPQKILAISSVHHISWLASALVLGGVIMGVYFLIYSLTLLLVMLPLLMFYPHINMLSIMTKSTLLINILMLSFMGLPPLLGFSMKWVVLMNLLEANMVYLAITLVLTSLFNIFMYLRLMFYSLIIKKMSWQKGSHSSVLNFYLASLSLLMVCAIPMLSY